jgi:2-oxoglutarate dehydrogenase E2 component (dihydrolipoamide succinyltransferase)|tara:strand:- start:1240 stop:1488 length:249 start_codon:yes stop_codon:yes gene_type:complete
MIEIVLEEKDWPTHEKADALVSLWKVKAGEHIEAGQNLLEIVVVKTAMEIPSPASGILKEICIGENELFQPGTVLARIDPVD